MCNIYQQDYDKTLFSEVCFFTARKLSSLFRTSYPWEKICTTATEAFEQENIIQ